MSLIESFWFKTLLIYKLATIALYMDHPVWVIYLAVMALNMKTF